MLNKANETAADLASEDDKTEVAKFIAEYKADGNIRKKVRSSTLDTAQDGADEIGTDNENASLHTAAEEGKIDVVRLLIVRGADVDTRTQHQWAPIHLSANNGYLDIVKLLLERGADLHALNGQGDTPYELLLQGGYREMADLLRRHGGAEKGSTRSFA